MKILQLISSGGQYGAENVVLELATSLQKLGCEPIVGVFENQHCPNTEILQSARERGLEGVRIRCAGRFDPKAIAEVRALVRQHGIEIVHTHGYKANFYGYRAARSCHIPIVATCHNWPGRTIPLLFYSLLDHALLRWFDAIIAVSDAVVRSLRRSAIPADKINLIENGIDVDRFAEGKAARESHNTGTEPRRIGFVGRLASAKALPFLFQAVRGVLNDFPRVELVLVGDGPERAALESLARELRIDKNTIFAGRQSDLPKLYSRFDIFVLCSLTEGMPMALLEAMATGVPVVATRVGGIPKVIKTEQNGLLIEPEDSGSLEAALRRLLEDGELRNRLGEAGRSKIIGEFSSQRMAKDYLRIYEQFVRRQNACHPTNAIPARSFAASSALPGCERTGMNASISTSKLASDTSLNTKREQIQFTVVIPALNEESVIGRCLNSLHELNFPSDDFEVIVVDNGSRDKTIEAARVSAQTLNLKILNEENCRVTKLRNVGAEAARGRFLAFLDADCLPPRDWLSFAAEKLSTSNPGIIGGHCGIPENSSWVCRIWYADRRAHKRGAVSYVPGANLLVRQVDFQKLGGFDESLETNEDCELCERARKNGLMVTAYPELGVMHLRDPQTLASFYRKQAWHGKHVLKVFLRNLPSTVNARPVLFALYTLLNVLGAVFSFATGRFIWVGVWAGLLFITCIVLSLRIALRRGRWLDFPPLVVLHLAYGLARASALVNPRNWIGQSKTSDRVNGGPTSSSPVKTPNKHPSSDLPSDSRGSCDIGNL